MSNWLKLRINQAITSSWLRERCIAQPDGETKADPLVESVKEKFCFLLSTLNRLDGGLGHMGSNLMLQGKIMNSESWEKWDTDNNISMSRFI
jgi:hypothetical protein